MPPALAIRRTRRYDPPYPNRCRGDGMVNIVEQAKQSPRNATPLGWDATALCYPGVNTCLTISAIGKPNFGKTKKEGMLVGMHLGLVMGAGEEGGKGSEDSKMIDDAYLGL